ncbi:MAG TPA: hypothetical protein VFP83_07875, partial [Candidatus Limnocylindria bacterium]|nr:hypothetical protein [Candidatus Limnocylindria bacterium]
LDSHAGLVAIGYDEYEPADPPGPVLGFAGWQASDGSWDPSPVTDEFLEDLGGGFLLYESAERVFAIGSGCRCGTGQPGRLWTSTDGLAWVQREETPPILYSVIRFGEGLLAAGIDNGEGAILISE